MKKTFILAFALLSVSVYAQKGDSEPIVDYVFTDIKTAPETPVKDQANSGTCWSFAGLGFIESDLMRKGKGEHDLSEMWIVRNTYLAKALKYARMHGHSNLGQGGATHDVFNVIDKYGIVPEEVYTGLQYGTDEHIHGEVDALIIGYMENVVKNKNRTLSDSWVDGLNGILDAYFGEIPEEFTYKGKKYTPESFAKELGIKGSDYQSYTSFTHHPFGSEFAIEVPDNWSWDRSKNVEIDELINIIDTALENGQSVLWASDVSEPGFQYNRGFAVLAEMDIKNLQDSEKAKWSALNDRERRSQLMQFSAPVTEEEVTQESRQIEFDNYQTTDDHGMVITGIAKDQFGNKFYRVKNSWNTDNVYDGYFYVSEPFVRAKTMNIVVNK